MAFGTSSKVFANYIGDKLNNTTQMDNNADTFKCALYGNTGTPSNTVASNLAKYNAGQWVTANEVSHADWAAGGLALASVSSTVTGTTYTFDAADRASGAAATLADVYGCLVYDDTITTPEADQAVCYNAFGGAQGVTAGVLTVVWSVSGIFSISVA